MVTDIGIKHIFKIFSTSINLYPSPPIKTNSYISSSLTHEHHFYPWLIKKSLDLCAFHLPKVHLPILHGRQAKGLALIIQVVPSGEWTESNPELASIQ